MPQGLQTRIRSQSPVVKSTARNALFGGTFDPVHAGHLHIARLAKQQASLNEVIFLPCQQSPHKTSATCAGINDRIAMLELAVADESSMRVDAYEATAPVPSYSYLTVQHFVEQEPDAEWFWLMGCDQWNALPRWKHPEMLARHLIFLVFSRGEIPQPRDGYRMRHLLGDHPASASALRDPDNEHHLDPAWLHPDVLHFILAKNLYH
jgi:nicotinate-nucleotide adenylyltransferase